MAELKAKEWASRSGLDKQPNAKPGGDPIGLYHESLKQELAENNAIDDRLARLVESEYQALIAAEAHDQQVRRIDERVDQTKRRLDAAINRMDELDAGKRYGGYQVRMLAPPGPAIGP